MQATALQHPYSGNPDKAGRKGEDSAPARVDIQSCEPFMAECRNLGVQASKRKWMCSISRFSTLRSIRVSPNLKCGSEGGWVVIALLYDKQAFMGAHRSSTHQPFFKLYCLEPVPL